MADELPIKATLGEFYKWLEKEGYIDEEVRGSTPTLIAAVDTFLESWPEERTPLAGTTRAQAREREAAGEDPASLKNITEENRSNASPQPDGVLITPSPDDLLMRAHENMDMYTVNADGRPVHNMRQAVLAENFALLAIAGYLKKIYELD